MSAWRGGSPVWRVSNNVLVALGLLVWTESRFTELLLGCSLICIRFLILILILIFSFDLIQGSGGNVFVKGVTPHTPYFVTMITPECLH